MTIRNRTQSIENRKLIPLSGHQCICEDCGDYTKLRLRPAFEPVHICMNEKHGKGATGNYIDWDSKVPNTGVCRS